MRILVARQAIEQLGVRVGLHLREPQPPPVVDERPDQPGEEARDDEEERQDEQPLHHVLPHADGDAGRIARPLVVAGRADVVRGVPDDLGVARDEARELGVGREVVRAGQQARLELEDLADRRRHAVEHLAHVLAHAIRVGRRRVVVLAERRTAGATWAGAACTGAAAGRAVRAGARPAGGGAWAHAAGAARRMSPIANPRPLAHVLRMVMAPQVCRSLGATGVDGVYTGEYVSRRAEVNGVTGRALRGAPRRCA